MAQINILRHNSKQSDIFNEEVFVSAKKKINTNIK